MTAVGMYGVPGPAALERPSNEFFPPKVVALRLRDHASIPVVVRLDWSSGEEYLEGIARRWWQRHVWVELFDLRIRTIGVWVDASDVRRR